MDHFVLVDRPLAGFAVPPQWADRFSYDPERRALSFRGFMCKAEFDQLNRLSDDWAYRRALENLFRLCTLEAGRPGLAGRLASALTGLVAGKRRVAHG